jgi:hypothetical protein
MSVDVVDYWSKELNDKCEHRNVEPLNVKRQITTDRFTQGNVYANPTPIL